MSKKPTEKTVHIDRVEDHDILDELSSEIETTETTIKEPASRRQHQSHREKISSSSGKRTARPYMEVMSTGKDPVVREQSKERFNTSSLDEVLEFINTDGYKSQRVKRPRVVSEAELEGVSQEESKAMPDEASEEDVLAKLAASEAALRSNSEKKPISDTKSENEENAEEIDLDTMSDEDDPWMIFDDPDDSGSRRRKKFRDEIEEELNKPQRRLRFIPIILIIALAFFAVSYYMFWREVSALFLIPVIVLVVLSVLFIILSKAKRTGKRIIGRVLSLILAAIMIVGGCGLTYMNIKLMHIMGQNADSTQMVVIVRMDDPAQKLADAKNYKFGYEDHTQPTSMKETIGDIENQIGAFVRTKYDSTEEECQDLLDGDIDAVIMNAVFVESMDDIIEDFSEKVRVIYTYTVDQAYLTMSPVKNGESFNVLISGIDTYGEIEAVSRSDVNQIMTVNPVSKQILLTSTPRDYYVTIPNISGDQRDKLTHAGIYGIQATADTLGNLYDIDINYYVRINFTSLIEVVDALGGVDVNSEVAFSAGGYDFVEGENHLNGEQALAFSRARHAFESGDNQRGKNQQYVITAILKKLMTREALTNSADLFDSLSGFVQTNMTQGEFVRLAADVLASGESYSIERTQATGEGGSDVTYSMPGRKLYVMYPDEKSVETIKKRIKAFLEAD